MCHGSLCCAGVRSWTIVVLGLELGLFDYFQQLASGYHSLALKNKNYLGLFKEPRYNIYLPGPVSSKHGNL